MRARFSLSLSLSAHFALRTHTHAHTHTFTPFLSFRRFALARSLLSFPFLLSSRPLSPLAAAAATAFFYRPSSALPSLSVSLSLSLSRFPPLPT